MILNAYAVLDASIAVLRFLLGLWVVLLAAAAWRTYRRPASPDGQEIVEDRGYLLFLQAFVLLGLNFISWPLLYLLLQSYVPEWPEVMCIYGVTQIGAGSLGPARFLPGLLTTLQITKPALVFVGGAWFVLYLMNRRSRTGPLAGRVLLLAGVMGTLAVCDAAAEGAYLGIPKKEEFPSNGCCATAFDTGSRASKFLPQALVGREGYRWLYAAYYAVNGGMVLALARAARRPQTGAALVPLVLGAALSLPVSAVFLVEVGAPAILHLPYHHCPYDLVPQAPEALLAVALLVGGSFCVGWACVAGWFGDNPETRPSLPQMMRGLMALGAFGYLFSLVMMSAELALA